MRYAATKVYLSGVTANEVDTGVDLDDDSVAGLDDGTQLACPHCSDNHQLAGVQAWLGDMPDFE